MAKSKSTRRPARQVNADRVPTLAERLWAVRALQKLGGTHMVRPGNCLVDGSPAQTVGRCRKLVDWLAQQRGDVAAADVLRSVGDALEHAETVLREIGSNPDWYPAIRRA